MEELKEKIIEKLQTIFDPEIPVSIYELGLIYEINILPINNVQVVMTLRRRVALRHSHCRWKWIRN